MALRQFLENNSELVANIIRVGEVTSVDPKGYKARVRFIDQEDTESYDLFILGANAGRKKRFLTPDVGDSVLCLFLPSGVETGFIIGAYYEDSSERPGDSGDVDIVEYEDGTRIVYDLQSGALSVSGAALVEVSDVQEVSVEVGGSKIEISASKILLESNGSSLELAAAGWKLSGLRGDLN